MVGLGFLIFGYLLGSKQSFTVNNCPNNNYSRNDNFAQKEVVLPSFQDYMADDYLAGKSVPADLNSHPDAMMYRTVIREATEEGPNFAEIYTIATWGCGTECQVSAIINRKNGKVYFPGLGSELGLDYRFDSKLIVVNPPQTIFEVWGSDIKEIPEWLTTRYYVWENEKLTLLKELHMTYQVVTDSDIAN